MRIGENYVNNYIFLSTRVPGFGLSIFISMTNLIIMTPYELGTIFILILQGNRLRWGHATFKRWIWDQFLVCQTPKPVLAWCLTLCSIMSLSLLLSSILMGVGEEKGRARGQKWVGWQNEWSCHSLLSDSNNGIMNLALGSLPWDILASLCMHFLMTLTITLSLRFYLLWLIRYELSPLNG